MFRLRVRCWLTGLVVMTGAALSVRADAVITLDPVGGAVIGAPGGTVGWGFTMTNGAYWVSIDSVVAENETSPVGGATGGFTSYMDILGGVSDGVTTPGETWILGFTAGSPGTGLGQYAIDPSAPPGAEDSGDFLIYYDEFSDNPNTCGSCYVDTLQMFDSNGNAPAFTIDVEQTSSSIPEPATTALILMGYGLMAVRTRRSQK